MVVIINRGTLQMGCLKVDDCRDEELPVREVSVEKFALGKYEVPLAAFGQFAKATECRVPDDFGWGPDDQPVINQSGRSDSQEMIGNLWVVRCLALTCTSVFVFSFFCNSKTVELLESKGLLCCRRSTLS